VKDQRTGTHHAVALRRAARSEGTSSLDLVWPCSWP
jgi:hypothetical protein